jgi:hypothetical protein
MGGNVFLTGVLVLLLYVTLTDGAPGLPLLARIPTGRPRPCSKVCWPTRPPYANEWGFWQRLGATVGKTRTIRNAECRSLKVDQSASKFQAARRSWRWCNLPTRGIATILPAEGGCTGRGRGQSLFTEHVETFTTIRCLLRQLPTRDQRGGWAISSNVR